MPFDRYGKNICFIASNRNSSMAGVVCYLCIICVLALHNISPMEKRRSIDLIGIRHIKADPQSFNV